MKKDSLVSLFIKRYCEQYSVSSIRYILKKPMNILKHSDPKSNNTARLLVKLTPAASHNTLVSLEKDLLGDVILKAMVTAIPEKGQANKALLKLLSKSLKLPKSAFNIIRGELSRCKLFEIDCPEKELLQKFQDLKII